MKQFKIITIALLFASSLLLNSCEIEPDVTPGSGSGGNSPGQVMFWTQTDLGCGSITVSISGYGSRTINSYYSSGPPSAGASGCATFTLADGNYYYKASCSGTTWSGTVNVSKGYCTKIKFISSGGSTGGGGSGGGGGGSGGGGNEPSQAMFYLTSDLNEGTIAVKLSGYSAKYITGYYSSGTPDCGASKCATYNIPAGTYSYTATGQGGGSWSGTVTVNNGQCSKVRLTGGSGGGSGGGGGGNDPTQLMFYSRSDLGEGKITVTVSGYGSRTISSYYSSGAPDCGASGCATFNLSSGSHSYTAKGQGGGTWSGTINASKGQCNRLQFTR